MTENPVPETLRMQRYLKNLASGVVATGREGLREGWFRADDALREKSYSVGSKWVYIFTRRKAKKEIPD
jgi:hypothetical protein